LLVGKGLQTADCRTGDYSIYQNINPGRGRKNDTYDGRLVRVNPYSIDVNAGFGVIEGCKF
jgi:hypothetical protein